MTAPLTAAELAELRELESKATPGPWDVAPYPGHVSAKRRLVAGCMGHQSSVTVDRVDECNRDNAAFIAAARNALPRLLAALEEADTLRRAAAYLEMFQ